jgi:macrolide transport system ATP-binding/permease protein
MELILKVKDIRVEFTGRDVLDIDELEVYDYDRIGLVGANGAGNEAKRGQVLGFNIRQRLGGRSQSFKGCVSR